jgi:hypothetical protein
MKITSKNTSLNQIPAGYKKSKKYHHLDNSVVFDYGCGKYVEKVQAWAKDNINSVVVGYDPYNRTTSDNLKALIDAQDCNVIVCNNVLNVLTDDKIDFVIRDIAALAIRNNIKKVYVTVYQGNRSGKGKISKKDCWQRNEKIVDHVERLKRVFDNVSASNGIITIKLGE